MAVFFTTLLLSQLQTHEMLLKHLHLPRVLLPQPDDQCLKVLVLLGLSQPVLGPPNRLGKRLGPVGDALLNLEYGKALR